jgi:hypothetical protein
VVLRGAVLANLVTLIPNYQNEQNTGTVYANLMKYPLGRHGQRGGHSILEHPDASDTGGGGG